MTSFSPLIQYVKVAQVKLISPFIQFVKVAQATSFPCFVLSCLCSVLVVLSCLNCLALPCLALPCFVSFRSVSFRFRFVLFPFRFVSFRFVSFRFDSFRFGLVRFGSVWFGLVLNWSIGGFMNHTVYSNYTSNGLFTSRAPSLLRRLYMYMTDVCRKRSIDPAIICLLYVCLSETFPIVWKPRVRGTVTSHHWWQEETQTGRRR